MTDLWNSGGGVRTGSLCAAQWYSVNVVRSLLDYWYLMETYFLTL